MNDLQLLIELSVVTISADVFLHPSASTNVMHAPSTCMSCKFHPLTPCVISCIRSTLSVSSHASVACLQSSAWTHNLLQCWHSLLDVVIHNRLWPCDTGPQRSFVCHSHLNTTNSIAPAAIQGCVSNSQKLKSQQPRCQLTKNQSSVQW